jgi:ketol-acid reductoisomerase
MDRRGKPRVSIHEDYREKLNAELEEMNNLELWQAGAAVRALRPENRKK